MIYLVSRNKSLFGSERYKQVPFEEAKLLKLNCDKALAYLSWHSTLLYDDTVRFITDWYGAYYKHTDVDMFALTEQQINDFYNEAKRQKIEWAL